MRARLDDLLAVQHGPSHLFRERQAEKGATKANDQGPHQQLLVDRAADIDAECREHDIDQQIDGKRQGEINENVGNQ
jgi:hypothetical protein